MYLEIYLLPPYISQVHVEVPALPRLPELYLEAGAALLMDQRPADCMVLCEEVISSTLELLPERLVLEEPEDTYETEAGAVGAGGDQRVGMLFWAGAAYLLQGHCYTQLKDWKQAVAHYTGYYSTQLHCLEDIVLFL